MCFRRYINIILKLTKEIAIKLTNKSNDKKEKKNKIV